MTDSSDVRPGIVLLCGRSFSGKSTLAAAMSRELRAVVVSFDAINAERGLISGQPLPLEEWGRTYAEAQSRTRDRLNRGDTVIVDDTSSPTLLRDGWRDLAAAAKVQLVLVYLDTPIEVSLHRHASNRADPSRMDVDNAVMHEHLRAFEPPEPRENALNYSTTNGDLTDMLLHIKHRLTGVSDYS